MPPQKIFDWNRALNVLLSSECRECAGVSSLSFMFTKDNLVQGTMFQEEDSLRRISDTGQQDICFFDEMIINMLVPDKENMSQQCCFASVCFTHLVTLAAMMPWRRMRATASLSSPDIE